MKPLTYIVLAGIVAAILATVYLVLWGQARGWAPPIDDGWRDIEGVDYV